MPAVAAAAPAGVSADLQAHLAAAATIQAQLHTLLESVSSLLATDAGRQEHMRSYHAQALQLAAQRSDMKKQEFSQRQNFHDRAVVAQAAADQRQTDLDVAQKTALLAAQASASLLDEDRRHTRLEASQRDAAARAETLQREATRLEERAASQLLDAARTRASAYSAAMKTLQQLTPKASTNSEWVLQASLIGTTLKAAHDLSLADNWMLVQYAITGDLLAAWHDFTKSNEARFTALPGTPFDWLGEFEVAMYSDAQHSVDVLYWQSLRQHTDTIRVFAAKFNKCLNSWGRFSADITEAYRVRHLQLAMNSTALFFLAMPDSPLVAKSVPPTTVGIFAYLVSKEAFAPPPADAPAGFGGVTHSTSAPTDSSPSRAGPRPSQAKRPYTQSTKASERAASFRSSGDGSGPRDSGAGPSRPRPARSPSPAGRSPSPTSRRIRCVRCHDYGHYAGACEAAMTPLEVQTNVRKVEAARASRTCWACSGEGHFAASCPAGPLPVDILAIWTAASDVSGASAAPVVYDDDTAFAVLAPVALLFSASPSAAPLPSQCRAPPSPGRAHRSSPSSPASDVSYSTNSSALSAALYELRHDLLLPLRDPPAVASSPSSCSCADSTPPSSSPPSEPDLDAFGLDAMAELAAARWAAAHLGEDSDRSVDSGDSDSDSRASTTSLEALSAGFSRLPAPRSAADNAAAAFAASSPATYYTSTMADVMAAAVAARLAAVAAVPAAPAPASISLAASAAIRAVSAAATAAAVAAVAAAASAAAVAAAAASSSSSSL